MSSSSQETLKDAAPAPAPRGRGQSKGTQAPTYLAFVSYKGGVGRSLAAVSCANALARGGSDVLIIDFDIEAPSIPTFYGFDSFSLMRESPPELIGRIHEGHGLVAWAVDREERGGELEPRLEFKKHLTRVRVSGSGSLRFLPAGPVGPGMLENLSHYRWQAWMRPRETERLWAKRMVSELKDSIASLDPSPNFVIVDTTAGLDAAAYRVLSDLADRAIFLVTNELGEKVVADEIKPTFAAGKFHVAISRVPTYFEEAEKYLSASQWKDASDLPIIRYDPLFGLAELAPSVPTTGLFVDPTARRAEDYEGRSTERREPFALTLDHLRLLARVLTEDALRDCIKDETVTRWLDRALSKEEQEDPGEHYKLFTLTGGTIFNPSDPEKAPNVSFRQETIRSIFNDVWRKLPADSGREDAFRQAGRNAGEGYGISLRDAMRKERRDVRAMLRRWCREDTQVGFGALRLWDFEPSVNSGRITVDHAFLPPQQHEGPDGQGDADLEQVWRGGSSIFSGYVEGVLRGLLGDGIEVDVSWAEGDTATPIGTTAVIRFGPRAVADNDEALQTS